MGIIVAHVVSTVVFKYCNFVLLLVDRVILLDLFQVKTTGKFNIYLPIIIIKGKFKIILFITGLSSMSEGQRFPRVITI